MSNIDKEWLQQTIYEMEAASDEIPFGLDDDDSNTLAALRIALASLEAKPVAAAYVINGVIEADDFASYCGHPKFQDGPIELYAAPHSTVSVPDFGALTKCIVQRLVDYGAADDDAIASAEEFVYNACRAAMFQGGKS